jgi:hypothetical protein
MLRKIYWFIWNFWIKEKRNALYEVFYVFVGILVVTDASVTKWLLDGRLLVMDFVEKWQNPSPKVVLYDFTDNQVQVHIMYVCPSACLLFQDTNFTPLIW